MLVLVNEVYNMSQRYHLINPTTDYWAGYCVIRWIRWKNYLVQQIYWLSVLDLYMNPYIKKNMFYHIQSIKDKLALAIHLRTGCKLREWVKQAQMWISPEDLVTNYWSGVKGALLDQLSRFETNKNLVSKRYLILDKL